MANKKRFETCTLTLNLSTSTPAVRMLVVEAYASREDDGSWDKGHDIYPVLALITKNVANYIRFRVDGVVPEHGATHEEMLSLGWRLDRPATWLDFDAVVYDPSTLGITEASVGLGDCSNGAYRIISAQWPAEEDDARLTPIIDAVMKEARDKVERNERHDVPVEHIASDN